MKEASETHYAYIIAIDSAGNVYAHIGENKLPKESSAKFLGAGDWQFCESAIKREYERLGVPQIKNNTSYGI